MSKLTLTLALLSPLALGACRRDAAPSAPEAAPPKASAAAPAKAPPAETAPALEGPLPLGTVLPDAQVKMKNVDGEMLSLDAIAGPKGTVVVFTCNHCPYAKAWEARIARIGNAYRDKGFGVVAINPNDPAVQPEDGFEQMQARAKELGLEFPYVVDATSNVARTYGATKTPEVYVFDADRELAYHGAVDDNARDPDAVEARYLEAALDAILAGAPVPMAETRAVGCSIKFRT